jgi:hypothetical protein
MLEVPSPETLSASVGALVGAVASADGLSVPQRETIRAVAHVFGAEVDPASVEPLTPEQAASVVTDPQQRLQLVHAMVMLAFMEHPPSQERERSIARYADAFDIDDSSVRVFHDYAHEQSKRMMFDVFRSMPLAGWERQYATEEGASTVVRSLMATLGHGSSPELTEKFRRLEQCPAGSLGRRLWEMYEANHWPFPGEKLGVPEATTVHDWVHVLAGYAPSPIGEIQVTAYISTSSPNPKLFGAVMLAVGLYEAGAFRLPQFTSLPKGGVLEEPHAAEALADAIQRGLVVNCDLMEGIDHWALANEQVVALRERFNIIAKNEPAPTPDPGLGQS